VLRTTGIAVELKPRFTDIGRELGAAVARMLTHRMMLPTE
jgi:hypothetical protein